MTGEKKLGQTLIFDQTGYLHLMWENYTLISNVIRIIGIILHGYFWRFYNEIFENF